jgi:hypothetical protein
MTLFAWSKSIQYPPFNKKSCKMVRRLVRRTVPCSDGMVGTGIFASWQRLLITAALQYNICSRGDFDYRYANDLA